MCIILTSIKIKKKSIFITEKCSHTHLQLISYSTPCLKQALVALKYALASHIVEFHMKRIMQYVFCV